MTDNDRRNPGPSGQEAKGQDPLLELTRLFNLDRNVADNQQTAETPAVSQNTGFEHNPTENISHNDPDLSFLDSEVNPATSDVNRFAGQSPAPQQVSSSENNLDFLPDGEQGVKNAEAEADLPFNELYDAPSFTPTARTPNSPVEAPSDFFEPPFAEHTNQPVEAEPYRPIEPEQLDSFEQEPAHVSPQEPVFETEPQSYSSQETVDNYATQSDEEIYRDASRPENEEIPHEIQGELGYNTATTLNYSANSADNPYYQQEIHYQAQSNEAAQHEQQQAFAFDDRQNYRPEDLEPQPSAESAAQNSSETYQEIESFDFLPTHEVPLQASTTNLDEEEYGHIATTQPYDAHQQERENFAAQQPSAEPDLPNYQAEVGDLSHNQITQDYSQQAPAEKTQQTTEDSYADDDFDFDKELENLLIEDPLRPDNEPSAQNIAADMSTQAAINDISDQIHNDVRLNAHEGSETQSNYVSQMEQPSPETHKADTPTETLSISDDVMDIDDPFGFGEVFAKEIAADDAAARQNGASSQQEKAKNPVTDPFDLEDLSLDEHIVSSVSTDEPHVSSQQPHIDEMELDVARQVHPGANNQHYDDNHEHLTAPTYQEPLVTEEYNQQAPSVENMGTEMDMHQMVGAAHATDKNGNFPPDVDTYKFADEIVETTEQIDVPDVPYPAEETAPHVDALEDEFADVFSVGKKQEPVENKNVHNEFFDDAYAQSGYDQTQPQYLSEEEQAAAQQYAAAHPYAAARQPYDDYPDYTQDPYNENVVQTGYATRQPQKSFGRRLAIGGVALVILAGGGYALNKFFSSSQESGESQVIHADNAPYKVQAENTNNESNTSNNQDVYNHASGAENAPEGEQNKLVDKSENPEDITALNDQIPQDNNGAYGDTSSVDDAIAASQSHTVPTREVQSVVVNPDGTIVPQSTPNNATDNNNNSATDSNSNNNQTASNNGAANNADNSNSTETAKEESELSKIITDDAHNEAAKSQAASPAQSNDSAKTQTSTAAQAIDANAKKNIETAAKRAETAKIPVTPTTTTQQPAKQVATTSVGAGGYYVQIASQPTQESAMVAMNKAKKQYGALFGSLPVNIQPAEIPGKGTYYRVRVQVGPRDSAINLCNRVKSQNGACFVGK